MPIGTIGPKGRTTIPKLVRDKLGLKPGDRLSWTIMNGHAVIRPKTGSVLDIAGMLYDPERKLLTIEEMNEAVMDAVAGHVVESMNRKP